MRTENVSAAAPTTIWWDEEVVTPLPRTVAEWRSIVMDAYVDAADVEPDGSPGATPVGHGRSGPASTSSTASSWAAC